MLETIEDLVTLRSGYGTPSERVAKKVLPQLGRHMREFIALSPFVVVATVGEGGRVDASPRGDGPGFVRVLDDSTLAIPDRPGNNRIDSSQNLLVDPHVGMIFFIPGVSETLRVNGTVAITFDEELRTASAHEGKLPRAIWLVTIEEAFFHCGKALVRADLWNPDKRIDRATFPSYAKITVDRFGGDLAERERHFEEDYKNKLY